MMNSNTPPGCGSCPIPHHLSDSPPGCPQRDTLAYNAVVLSGAARLFGAALLDAADSAAIRARGNAIFLATYVRSRPTTTPAGRRYRQSKGTR